MVKAFNNIFFAHLAELARPAVDADRSVLPVAGNAPAAKKRRPGCSTPRLRRRGRGALSEGWRFQRDTPADVQPYAFPGSNYPTWPGRQGHSRNAEGEVDAAVRYRDM